MKLIPWIFAGMVLTLTGLVLLFGCAKPAPTRAMLARAPMPSEPKVTAEWHIDRAADFWTVTLTADPEPSAPWHFERSTNLVDWFRLPDDWRGNPRTYIVSREPYQRPASLFWRVVCSQ